MEGWKTAQVIFLLYGLVISILEFLRIPDAGYIMGYLFGVEFMMLINGLIVRDIDKRGGSWKIGLVVGLFLPLFGPILLDMYYLIKAGMEGEKEEETNVH